MEVNHLWSFLISNTSHISKEIIVLSYLWTIQKIERRRLDQSWKLFIHQILVMANTIILKHQNHLNISWAIRSNLLLKFMVLEEVLSVQVYLYQRGMFSLHIDHIGGADTSNYIKWLNNFFLNLLQLQL